MQDPNDATPAQDAQVDQITQELQSAPASSPAPGAQPDGTTLDPRAAATSTSYVGDIVDVFHEGEQREGIVLLHATIARLVELAQQVHHFVADEGSAVVKELKIVAADVGRYL